MGDENEEKLCKKKQGTAQSKFTRIYNQFHTATAKSEDTRTLQGLLKDLEHAYQNLEEKHT